jgi:hypothetical protein
MESFIERHPPESRIDTIGALDPLYCLAMLALQNGRADQAAKLFGRVAQVAEFSPVQKEIFAAARYHESLSRERG